jgi:hypothetical protein
MDRWLAVTFATVTTIYVLAFATGSYPLRAITGVAMLVVVLWLIAWTWRSYLASDRSLAGLALAFGLTTFTYGAIIGVLLQLQYALGTGWLSGEAISAHAGAMVFSSSSSWQPGSSSGGSAAGGSRGPGWPSWERCSSAAWSCRSDCWREPPRQPVGSTCCSTWSPSCCSWCG